MIANRARAATIARALLRATGTSPVKAEHRCRVQHRETNIEAEILLGGKPRAKCGYAQHPPQAIGTVRMQIQVDPKNFEHIEGEIETTALIKALEGERHPPSERESLWMAPQWPDENDAGQIAQTMVDAKTLAAAIGECNWARAPSQDHRPGLRGIVIEAVEGQGKMQIASCDGSALASVELDVLRTIASRWGLKPGYHNLTVPQAGAQAIASIAGALAKTEPNTTMTLSRSARRLKAVIGPARINILCPDTAGYEFTKAITDRIGESERTIKLDEETLDRTGREARPGSRRRNERIAVEIGPEATLTVTAAKGDAPSLEAGRWRCEVPRRALWKSFELLNRTKGDATLHFDNPTKSFVMRANNATAMLMPLARDWDTR